jgi:hypothetical protein
MDRGHAGRHARPGSSTRVEAAELAGIQVRGTTRADAADTT